MKYSVTVIGIYSHKKVRNFQSGRKLPQVPLEADSQTKGSD